MKDFIDNVLKEFDKKFVIELNTEKSVIKCRHLFGKDSSEEIKTFIKAKLEEAVKIKEEIKEKAWMYDDLCK